MVSRDDYARNHFDRRPCESEVEIGTSYYRVCAVAIPDGDGVAEMASGCLLVRAGGNPACIDGERSTTRRHDRRSRGSSDESDSPSESDDKSSEDGSGSDKLNEDDGSASNIVWRCSRIRWGAF